MRRLVSPWAVHGLRAAQGPRAVDLPRIATAMGLWAGVGALGKGSYCGGRL
jgi:hypothetical protein